MARSWGVVTSYRAAGISRNDASSTLWSGRPWRYVQGFGLKAMAVVSVRLTNSPATRGNSGSRFVLNTTGG